MDTKFLTVGVLLMLYAITSLATYGANYDTLQEIHFVAEKLGTPTAIHQYAWETTHYEKRLFSRSLRAYWEDKRGDCTEVANVEYEMLKHLGYKTHRITGFVNGERHYYVRYYDDGKWKQFDDATPSLLSQVMYNV